MMGLVYRPGRSSAVRFFTAIFAMVILGVAGAQIKAHAALYSASNELGQYATLPFQPTGWPDYGGDGVSDTGAQSANIPNAYGLDFPDSTALDTVNHRLFVADASNFRVLVYQLDSNNNFATGTPAIVLGQTDFNSNPDSGGTINDQELNFPEGLAYDPSTNRLFVADGNNRVLVFDATPGTLTNNAHAIHVLGQADMFSANAATSQSSFNNVVELAIDVAGQRLFAVDNSNARIMVFNIATSTMTDGELALHELGQVDFNTRTLNQLNQTGFTRPLGVAYDPNAQRIFVADSFNNRVLIFDGASSTMFDNEPAVHILGGAVYNSNFGGAGTSTVNSSSLDTPFGMAYDAVNDRLFVEDDRNNRVVVYNVATSTFTDGESASFEVGQLDMNSKINGAGEQNDIWDPEGNVSYDPTSGNLFVPDEANNRILVFDARVGHIANGENAKSEVGQYSYLYPPTGGPIYTNGSSNNGLSRAIDIVGFGYPRDLIIDSKNHRLFVNDNGDNRILIYQLDNTNQLTSPLPVHIIGQSDYRSSDGFSDQIKLTQPYGMSYDPDSERLFVLDGGSRVVVFDVNPGTVTDGERAQHILATPPGTYTFTQATTTQSGFAIYSGGAALYDKTTQRLFVSDMNNGRVMVFNAGTSTLVDNENASFVLGQQDFFTANQTTTQNGLDQPRYLAYDTATERLFVSDDSRVMVFDVATSTIANHENASFVLGQPDFFTNNVTTTRNGLNDVEGVAFDPLTNQLFVSDNGNSRIMVFDVATSTIATAESAQNVIGQSDFVSSVCSVTQNTLCNPTGVALDTTNNLLYISDAGNSRVLQYNLVNITTNSLANATSGSAYSATVSANSNQGALSFAVDPGSTLPSGLSLATTTGVISGTPAAAGSFTFAIDAIDSFSTGPITAVKNFSLTVAGGGGGGGSALTITPTSTLPGATTTVPYSQVLTASGTVGGTFTWSIASGALPGGITLDTSSTVTTTTLSGTPNATGTFNFSVHVVNGASSGTQAMSITVNAGAAPTYTITVTQGSNGTIAPGTQSGLAGGSSQGFTITPNAGFQVQSVTVDGSSVGAVGSYTFNAIAANHTITASFSATGGGGGGGGGVVAVGGGGTLAPSPVTPTSTTTGGSSTSTTSTPSSTPVALTPPPLPAVPPLPTSTKNKNGFVFVVVDVLNGYGGTATPANFTMAVKGSGASPSSFAGSASGTLVAMKPQAYSLSQSKGVAGYTTTFSSGCSGATVLSQATVCQVIETQLQPPRLTVIQNIINSSFGTLSAGNFTVAVKGTGVSPASFAGNAAGTAVALAPGAYSVSEKSVGSYTITFGSGCGGTAVYGGAYTCTITAQDPAQSHLVVTESVTNGYGGIKLPQNFTVKVTGTSVAPGSFAGNASGTLVTMKPGAYSVSQAAVAGYATIFSAGCSGTALAGQTIACSVTVTQLAPPKLTVVERVVNSYFGTSTAANFTVAVKGTGVSPASFAGNAAGTAVALAPGAYSVSEKSVNNYAITLGSGCSGTAAYGGVYTCTIVASDPPISKLRVVENVLNNYDGTKIASNFTIKISGTSVVPSSFAGSAAGTAVTLKPGAYAISQTAVKGYVVSYTPGCSGSVIAGETIECDIVTSDLPPPQLTVYQSVVSAFGGTATSSNFTVGVKATGVSSSSFAGSAAGTVVSFTPGGYSVSEKAISGYTVALGKGCSGTGAYSGIYSCLVTATQTKPKGYVPPPVVPPTPTPTSTPTSTPITTPTSTPTSTPQTPTSTPIITPTSTPVAPTSTPIIIPTSTPTSSTPTSTPPTPTSTPPIVSTSTEPTSTPSTPTSTPPIIVPTSTTPTSTPTSTAPTGGGTTVIASGGGTPTNGSGSGSPPTQTGGSPIDITINAGGTVVTSTQVVINLGGSGVANGGSVQTSNEGGQDQTGWVPVAPSYPWTLTPGQGIKTVTVDYMPPGAQVLAASTSRSVFLYLGQDILSQPKLDCASADYLTGYAFARHPQVANPAQVIKIQQFLNKFMGTSLVVTGVYDKSTQAVVAQFQLQFKEEILQPWVQYGLPNSTTPTSNTYKTTQRWINILACPGLSLPLPQLP